MVDEAVVLSVIGAVGGPVAFVRAFQKLRALRRVENTPTSAVRSMPMGLVELHGTAYAKNPLYGPFTGKPVAYYEVQIEEYRRTGRHSRWVTRHTADSADHPFWLEDATGRVLVLPAGSETHLPRDYRRTLSGRNLPTFLDQYLTDHGIGAGLFGLRPRLRFTERHVAIGQLVYLHGVAQERPDLHERRRERIGEILQQVREDPDAMGELDVDGDGRVDSIEWERARDRALARVRAEGIPDRIVIAKGGPRDLFLISDRSERDLVRRLRWESAAGVFGGGGAFVAGTAYLIHTFF